MVIKQRKKANELAYLTSSLILAYLLWFIIFFLKPFNFWLEMSMATILLLAISYKKCIFNKQISVKSFILGLIAAAILYLIFLVGNFAAGYLPSAKKEISLIYSLSSTLDIRIASFLLVFPIAVGEEFFWRGFVQAKLSNIFGEVRGFLMASLAYASVHLSSLNFMLFLAAFAGGLWWGYLFKKSKDLVLVIISHAFWSLLIFVLIPIT
jgi:hypothetical protein